MSKKLIIAGNPNEKHFILKFKGQNMAHRIEKKLREMF